MRTPLRPTIPLRPSPSPGPLIIHRLHQAARRRPCRASGPRSTGPGCAQEHSREVRPRELGFLREAPTEGLLRMRSSRRHRLRPRHRWPLECVLRHLKDILLAFQLLLFLRFELGNQLVLRLRCRRRHSGIGLCFESAQRLPQWRLFGSSPDTDPFIVVQDPYRYIQALQRFCSSSMEVIVIASSFDARPARTKCWPVLSTRSLPCS